jgi:hypothetical protein
MANAVPREWLCFVPGLERESQDSMMLTSDDIRLRINVVAGMGE